MKKIKRDFIKEEMIKQGKLSLDKTIEYCEDLLDQATKDLK